MKIKISNLSDGTHELNFSSSVDELDISEPYFGPVEISVIISKFGDQLILNSETEINANLVCDRCNTEFKKLVKSNYKMIYLVDDSSGDQNDEVTYIKPMTDKISIDEDVREYALLALPMKTLCKDDCKGLCYKCGTNLNLNQCSCDGKKTNEMWEPLLKLKKNSN